MSNLAERVIAAKRLEQEIVDWLALLPVAAEGDLAKMRKLGAALFERDRTAPECCLALALHYLGLIEKRGGRDSLALLGRAKQLLDIARVLESNAASSEWTGKCLASLAEVSNG